MFNTGDVVLVGFAHEVPLAKGLCPEIIPGTHPIANWPGILQNVEDRKRRGVPDCACKTVESCQPPIISLSTPLAPKLKRFPWPKGKL